MDDYDIGYKQGWHDGCRKACEITEKNLEQQLDNFKKIIDDQRQKHILHTKSVILVAYGAILYLYLFPHN